MYLSTGTTDTGKIKELESIFRKIKIYRKKFIEMN